MAKPAAKLINLALSEEDAQLFVKFRQYQTVFQTLVEQGFFEVQNGHATAFFNDKSRIMEVELSTKRRIPTKQLDKL